ncbi:MAG: hypothetical protein Q8L01_03700 [Candidatus Woesebacteria bacterium]|nr:hypothetical protein [Candidatus Woesebacteria bacterium]
MSNETKPDKQHSKETVQGAAVILGWLSVALSTVVVLGIGIWKDDPEIIKTGNDLLKLSFLLAPVVGVALLFISTQSHD